MTKHRGHHEHIRHVDVRSLCFNAFLEHHPFCRCESLPDECCRRSYGLPPPQVTTETHCWDGSFIRGVRIRIRGRVTRAGLQTHRSFHYIVVTLVRISRIRRVCTTRPMRTTVVAVVRIRRVHRPHWRRIWVMESDNTPSGVMPHVTDSRLRPPSACAPREKCLLRHGIELRERPSLRVKKVAFT